MPGVRVLNCVVEVDGARFTVAALVESTAACSGTGLGLEKELFLHCSGGEGWVNWEAGCLLTVIVWIRSRMVKGLRRERERELHNTVVCNFGRRE